MIKKIEVLIHECSKRGNISWKNPTKCISDAFLEETDGISARHETLKGGVRLFHVTWRERTSLVTRRHHLGGVWRLGEPFGGDTSVVEELRK